MQPPLLLPPDWLESPSQRCLKCRNKPPECSLVPAWASTVGCSVSPATSWTWLSWERLLSKPSGGSPRLLTKAEALAGTTKALDCSFLCVCFRFLFTFQSYSFQEQNLVIGHLCTKTSDHLKCPPECRGHTEPPTSSPASLSALVKDLFYYLFLLFASLLSLHLSVLFLKSHV